jgi:ClpP class serine protease
MDAVKRALEWIFSLKGLALLLFIVFFVAPLIESWRLARLRAHALSALEKKRGSRVIAMIHREESVHVVGIPVVRYIDIEDSEEILRAIRLTGPNTPIDFVLHTPGGLVLAASQIAKAIKRHPGKTTVFVPHYAMSGGTLIALAANEIVMDRNAVLGPIDPQFGSIAAASVLKVVESKSIDRVHDLTLILADQSRKAIAQVADLAHELLSGKMPAPKAREIARRLASGTWTHDFPITMENARELIGLPVSNEIPEEIHEMIALYPQSRHGQSSVVYFPEPRYLGREPEQQESAVR